jgi:hypothetical protein
MTHRGAAFALEVTAPGQADCGRVRVLRAVTAAWGATCAGCERAVTASLGASLIGVSVVAPAETYRNRDPHLPRYLASLATFPLMA